MVLPDIHANLPDVPVSLNRVGITDLKKVINTGKTSFTATIDLFADLRADRKGINLSRNLEAVNELVESVPSKSDAELLCAGIARKLLEKHEEAERVEANLKARVKVDFEFDLIGSAVAYRKKGESPLIKKAIGAEVVGITVCPCAQELVKEYSRGILQKKGIDPKILDELPIASHNQRSVGTLIVETDENERVDAAELAKIVRDSMSAPVSGLLKRPDERDLIIQAHANPKFVEDCVRGMLARVAKLNLSDDAVVIAKQKNYESIHEHNAYAERTVKFADLKKELKGNGSRN
ncbi:GTP cyclohydrolase MptA [Candidatus Gugararchaeum adminiculabundum]|nr:GTP cyclohydrolase MptA [Candidatus Gugararchaeum adminiculabundum]